MKSPHQYRAKASPRTVTLEGGIKLAVPMTKSRATPSTKTAAKICTGPKNC